VPNSSSCKILGVKGRVFGINSSYAPQVGLYLYFFINKYNHYLLTSCGKGKEYANALTKNYGSFISSSHPRWNFKGFKF